MKKYMIIVNMNNVGLIFCKLEYIVNKCEK